MNDDFKPDPKDFWFDLKPDQKFELEKQKLRLEEKKVRLEKGLEKHQIEKIVIKRIVSISVVICIPLSIFALLFGASFILKNKTEKLQLEGKIRNDAIKIERAAENTKYKISVEKPIRDTVYDTISIIQINQVLLKKGTKP